jgi:hypothetical protein
MTELAFVNQLQNALEEQVQIGKGVPSGTKAS